MFEFGPKQTKWLKLLESGKLKQVKGSLCEINAKTGKVKGFCCLGVAQAGVMKIKPQVLQNVLADAVREDGKGFLDKAVEVAFKGNTSALDDKSMRAMKFRSSLGASEGWNHKSLSELNDSGKTFKKIAALVRKYPDRYFTGPA